MGVALGTVTDDGNLFTFYYGKVTVFVVIDIHDLQLTPVSDFSHLVVITLLVRKGARHQV
jgi:hypothetical protein